MIPLQSERRRTVRFQSLRVIFALIMREMNTRYGRSPGGYVWAIAEPIGMVSLLSVIFIQVIRTPPIGNSFVLFYATGYLAFHVYSEIASTTSMAIQVNRNLLRYPVVTPLDTVLSRFFLTLFTQMLVALLLLGGVVLFFKPPVNFDIKFVALSFLVASIVGLGVGTMNSVLFSFYPTWQRVWVIANRPLFIVSGVFFLFEELPGYLRAVLWFNPVVHPVGLMRAGFYGFYRPDYVSYTYTLGLGMTLFVAGGYLLRRHRSRITER